MNKIEIIKNHIADILAVGIIGNGYWHIDIDLGMILKDSTKLIYVG
jgi:hypothetical protein